MLTEVNGGRSSSYYQFLPRCYSGKGHIESFVVVSRKPLCRVLLHLLNTVKQILVQPVVTNSAIVALHIPIFLRVARLNTTVLYAELFGPCSQNTTDVFRAVVTPNAIRRGPPLNRLIERAPNPLNISFRNPQVDNPFLPLGSLVA